MISIEYGTQGESFFDPPCLLIGFHCKESSPFQGRLSGSSASQGLLLLPGARFLMDSRNLSAFSMQVLTEQFRREHLITQALLQHWFLGKVFYYFMAVSLDTVALIFSWGNIMKFLWKKYAFPHNHVIIIFFFLLQFLQGLTFLLLGQIVENSHPSLSKLM